MPSRNRSILTVTLLALFAAGYTISRGDQDAHAASDETKAATQVALKWLSDVDAGRYAASWKESASLFKKAVTEEQWAAAAKAARAPLGALQKRELMDATAHKELPGAPDGEYVVVRFRTSFANKADAVETVTPMKDGARGWRVSGYYVK